MPRPERAIGMHEGPEHLNHERPEIDWFAEHPLVVRRVRNQIGVQVAGYATGELHRRERGDSFELQVLPPLSGVPWQFACHRRLATGVSEIGRASCRERV